MLAAAPPVSGLFGGSKEGQNGKKDAPAVPSFGLAGASSTAKDSAPTVAVPPPSVLKGKSIEEIINRWSTELESHVREFNRFASEVGVWDRTLIDNGNNVSTFQS
jgi:nuclear pore complex protein Nup62